MNTQSRVLRWSLIIGIMIVLNLFFNYTLSLIYKSPDYNAYCPVSSVISFPATQQECVAQGGQWTDNTNGAKFAPPGTIQPAGSCDTQFTCRNNYDTATKAYNRNVFLVLIVLGALCVMGGNFFKGNSVISNGLALGGVLSFLIASMRYWSAANDAIRVLILAIALGILFWVAMKKFNERVQS